MVDSSEWTAIEHLVRRMQETFPTVPPEKVTEVVHHNHARFDGRPVRDFVPLFVERGSRRQLSQICR